MVAILMCMRWYFIVILSWISLVISNVEHLFTWLLASCMSSLEKCLFRSSAYFLIGFFVFLILSCVSGSCILDINPLLVTSFASIFSHLVGCFFILFMVFSTVQKYLSLIRSHSFTLAYFFFLWRLILENNATIYVKNVWPVFSSRDFNFVMSYMLVFKPFWVYFCLEFEEVLQFHWFIFSCLAFPATHFSHCIFLPFLLQINWP